MEDQITIAMEGMPDTEYISLSDFQSELRLFSSLLSRADREVTGRRTYKFQVVGLSQESPASVTIRAFSEEKQKVPASAVIERFIKTTEQIRAGEVYEDLGYEFLRDLRDMSDPVGERLESLVLRTDSASVPLDIDFSANVQKLLSTEDECLGDMEGTLEQINIHAGANTFRIYPAAGPSSVLCRFKMADLEIAKEAIGREIRVFGNLLYRPYSVWPHEIRVMEMETYLPEAELPTFEDIQGIAPNATDDLTSEEFIARLRDGWGR